MPSFTLTNLAKADLKGIAIYTQDQWGRDQRDVYLTLLDACFHQLAANPLKGKDCSDIRNGYRKRWQSCDFLPPDAQRFDRDCPYIARSYGY